MKRAKTIVLGLACFMFYSGIEVCAETSARNNRDKLEALLADNRDDMGDDTELAALVSAIADHESAYENAQERIAQLEQLLADREAIILQLSADTPEEDVGELKRENEMLSDALEAALAERDQIRADFNRLFEGGEFAQPALGDDEASDEEDGVLRERLGELEVRLAELHDKLIAVSDERDALAAQVASPDDVHADFVNMEEALVETRQTLEQLRVSLEVSEEEQESLQLEVRSQQEAFASALQAADEELEQVRHSLETSEQERESLHAEMQSQQEMLDSKLRAALEEKEELSAALAESEVIRADLEERLAAEPEDESDLREELEKMRALDASRRVTMDELMLQIGDLRTSSEQLAADNARLQEELAERSEQLKAREAILAERNEIIDELREERDGKAKLLAGAWEKVESQAEEMGTLRGQIRDMEEALAESRTSYEMLEQRKSETENNLASARSQIEDLQIDIAGLEERGREQQEEFDNLQNELARTLLVDDRRRRVLDETLEKLAEVEERESSLLTEREDYRERLHRLESEREVLRSELTDSEAKVAALQEEIDASTAKVSDLRVSLADREQELRDTVALKRSLQEDFEKQEEAASATREQYEAVRGELREAQQSLSEKADALESTLSELESIRLVDDRRRRTLDETLATLAQTEQRKKELASKVEASDEELVAVTEEQREELVRLRERNAVLEGEIKQLEEDLRLAEERVSDPPQIASDSVDELVAALEARNIELQEALSAAGDSAAVDMSEDVALQIDSLQAQVDEAEQLLDQHITMQIAAEDRVAALADELGVLQSELETTQATAASKAEELQRLQRELESARRIDVRETDLYRELESDMALVRDKLVEVESERGRLRGSVERLEEKVAAAQAELGSVQRGKEDTASALASAKEREVEYRELLDRLVPEVRELEEKLTELRRERELMASRLLQREDDLEALHVELEQREHRLARAERVAEVLERTRSEVEEAQRKQRLNMHYNMASVYARDGRYSEAEYEYLQALRLDPTDADVHYNLGILYDDELGQPDKAILHYRRYLQLNPHGVDADRVRSWLLRLEMDQGR